MPISSAHPAVVVEVKAVGVVNAVNVVNVANEAVDVDAVATVTGSSPKPKT